jgi:catechol 2,3-dioxygenase-like lactoylglutathione lyase family enzyme
MIEQLGHICFTTRSLDQTVAFYRDVLGLEVTFRFLRDENPIGCFFHAGNQTYLECFERAQGDHEAGDIRHICFQVRDLDEVETRLQEAGVESRGRRVGSDGCPQLWCTDPNGIDVEFQVIHPECCQQTGTDCHVEW